MSAVLSLQRRGLGVAGDARLPCLWCNLARVDRGQGAERAKARGASCLGCPLCSILLPHVLARVPASQSFRHRVFCSILNMTQLCGREGDGTPLQYSCLENPTDGEAWWAAVHGVMKSRTRLSDFTFTFHFHALEKEMATHSSVLAWRIPGMGESLVGCRLWGPTESDMTEAT